MNELLLMCDEEGILQQSMVVHMRSGDYFQLHVGDSILGDATVPVIRVSSPTEKNRVRVRVISTDAIESLKWEQDE